MSCPRRQARCGGPGAALDWCRGVPKQLRRGWTSTGGVEKQQGSVACESLRVPWSAGARKLGFRNQALKCLKKGTGILA